MECLRRMTNCSPNTPWDEKAEYLNQYMNMMRVLGYSKSERYHTLKGAIERYDTMCNEVALGDRASLYRSGKVIRKAQREQKSWSNTWFLKGDVKATVSCPVTPGGILKSKLSKTVNQDRMDVRSRL